MHYEQRKISSGVKIGSADITQRQTPTINIRKFLDRAEDDDELNRVSLE